MARKSGFPACKKDTPLVEQPLRSHKMEVLEDWHTPGLIMPDGTRLEGHDGEVRRVECSRCGYAESQIRPAK